MEIRELQQTDWPQVWEIIRDVVTRADTFTYDPRMSEPEAHRTWVFSPPGLSVVAVEGEAVLGTAALGPNGQGPGSHIATGSFMVSADNRHRGVGTALCEFALSWAARQGYAGMQFNAVAETNTAAVQLYQRLGFEVLCTVPGAFQHPHYGRIGLHVMFHDLLDVES